MMPPLLQILLLAVALAASLCAVRLLRDLPPLSWPWAEQKKQRRRRRYHPIGGTVVHELLNVRRLYDYHTDLSRRYTTFRLLSPAHDEVFTVDPANVEYILRTNASNYGKGWHNYDKMKDLFGDGIFVVDGDKWREQRKFASFEFSSRILRNSTTVTFKNTAIKLAQKISDAAANNEIIEIQDLFMKATMDSTFEIMSGIELNTLLGSNPEGCKFAKAFDDSTTLVTLRFVNSFWKIMKLFNVGPEAALKRNIKVLDDFIYNLILIKIDNQHSQQYDSGKKEDFLTRLLMENEKDPKKNHKYIRDIILNFLIAGKDTTGGTLSWFFYLLCKHSSVQEKIAHEVQEATKSHGITSFEGFSKNISEEAIDKMQYLHAALSETLRLFPAVPLDAKVCFSDDTLPDGFTVRKGDTVDYQPYPMGRMRNLWGDDAEVFRPERWIDENGLFHPESPFKFTAFQAGPRICMGKEFAYRQMKIFAAVLLRFFKFKLNDEDKDVTYRITLTLPIDEGLHLYAFRR